jgi:hypothetical protein
VEKVGATFFLVEFGGSLVKGLRKHGRRRNHRSLQSLAAKKR